MAMKDFAAVMEKVRKGEGSLGSLVNNDSLYNSLQHSAEDLDKLMQDLKQNPSRYVHFSVFGKKDKTKKNSSNETHK